MLAKNAQTSYVFIIFNQGQVVSVRSLAISGIFGLVAMAAAPLYIRSMIPDYAPPPKGPNVVDAGDAYCLVSPKRNNAVIVEAGTRQAQFLMQNPERKDNLLSGDALNVDNGKVEGTFSVEFDKKNRIVKCARDEKIYVISWRGGYNFDAP